MNFESMPSHPLHTCTRRKALALSFAILLAYSTTVCGKETALPTPTSLRQVASAAQAKGEPLVVLVSLPGCPWCELLRRNYLVPMRSEGVHAFQITVNDRQVVITNFQGLASHGAAIAQSYRAQLTPTVLFLSASGAEIAPRIEGVASVDLIGSLLDERLDTARKRLRL
jgi:thioredoxin-related protein